jgi:hypothetical protein
MMKRLTKNTRALGTPVANIIVLTAAVLLTTTVVFFAVNVTNSQVQKESMYISKTHLWYVNSTNSIAAITIVNTGPTDIVLNRIVIKGLDSSWNSTTNFIIYNKTAGVPQGDLPFVSNFTNTEPATITVGSTDCTFVVAEEGLTLKSGDTMMFYIAFPDRLMVYDLGQPVRMVISTTQAAYATEVLVQAT